MRRRTITWRALLLGALLLAAPAAAQTTTSSAKWHMAEAPAAAQALQYFLGNSATALTAKLAPTCVAAASGADCTSTIPKLSDGSSVLVPGNLVLYATNGTTSSQSDPFPFNPGTVSKPTGFTISVNIVFP